MTEMKQGRWHYRCWDCTYAWLPRSNTPKRVEDARCPKCRKRNIGLAGKR